MDHGDNNDNNAREKPWKPYHVLIISILFLAVERDPFITSTKSDVIQCFGTEFMKLTF